MPAATHRFFISPPVQCFTLCMVVRATEIIDSMALVQVNISASEPPMPRRRTANMSSRPSSKLAAASGCSGRSSPASRLAGVQAFPRVGVGEHEPQAGIDLVAELLGQVPSDISPFMQNTPLYNGFFAEDLGHAGRQGLGPVDDDEQPGLGR